MQNNTLAKIAIVEDDTEILRLTTLLLESEGYECKAVARGDLAADLIRSFMPDLVILDIMLPGKSGLEVCQDIRSFYRGGVLMLTGRDDDITQLTSFKKGADDFVIKPLKPHLLLARVEALLRRTQPREGVGQNDVLQLGKILVDKASRSVMISEQPVALTSAEFDVLALLASHAGHVVSREDCCEQLRGFSYDASDRSIDMRVSSLRKKLNSIDEQGKRIITVRNRGYMLSVGGEAL